MDLAQALRQLFRRKLLLAVGLLAAAAVAVVSIYDVRPGFPPELRKQELQFGTAQLDILVDSPESPIGDLSRDFGPLYTRALVYARLVSSAPVKALIAAELGVPAAVIEAGGPPPVSAATRGRETSAQQRAQELVGEGRSLRLIATAVEESPVVSILAQAPTAELAVKLADAASAGLSRYILQLQVRQQVQPRTRARIQTLGKAQGGLVNQGIDYQMGGLAFFGFFGLWCVAILLFVHVRQSLRESADAERALEGLTGPDGAANGHAPVTGERRDLVGS